MTESAFGSFDRRISFPVLFSRMLMIITVRPSLNHELDPASFSQVVLISASILGDASVKFVLKYSPVGRAPTIFRGLPLCFHAPAPLAVFHVPVGRRERELRAFRCFVDGKEHDLQVGSHARQLVSGSMQNRLSSSESLIPLKELLYYTCLHREWSVLVPLSWPSKTTRCLCDWCIPRRLPVYLRDSHEIHYFKIRTRECRQQIASRSRLPVSLANITIQPTHAFLRGPVEDRVELWPTCTSARRPGGLCFCCTSSSARGHLWLGLALPSSFDSSEVRHFLLSEKLCLLIYAILGVKFRRVVLEALEVYLAGIVVPELRAVVLVFPAIKFLPLSPHKLYRVLSCSRPTRCLAGFRCGDHTEPTRIEELGVR